VTKPLSFRQVRLSAPQLGLGVLQLVIGRYEFTGSRSVTRSSRLSRASRSNCSARRREVLNQLTNKLNNA
jgi:hypothetical protein